MNPEQTTPSDNNVNPQSSQAPPPPPPAPATPTPAVQPEVTQDNSQPGALSQDLINQANAEINGGSTAVSPEVNPQPQPQPLAQPAGTIGTVATQAVQEGSGSSKKKFIIGGIAGLIAAVAAAGAFVIFAYLPNTPTNVWRRGMASVGVGLEEVLKAGADTNNTNTNMTGSFSMTSPTEITATMNGNYDVESGSGAFKLNVNAEGYEPELELRYLTPEASSFPQMYVMLSGFERAYIDYFGAQDLSIGGEKVEGSWWSLDFNQLVSDGIVSSADLAEGLDASLEETFTQEDYQKLMTAMLSASNEFMFTSELDKMVFETNEVLEKEEYEGVESQKYSVNLNKDNLKLMLKKMRDNVDATGLVKKLGIDKPLYEEMSDSDIDSFVDDIDESETDMYAWVALDTKVLRNIRFVDVRSTGDEYESYFDVSILLEKDSTKIPLRFKIVDENEFSRGVFESTITLDTESSTIDFNLSGNTGYKEERASDYAFEMNMQLMGTSEAPLQEIPENPKSLNDVINKEFSSAQASARDTQRKTDINNIWAKLEEHYNENGYYPKEFDQTTLLGIDSQALVDPDGKSIEFFVTLGSGIGEAPNTTDVLPRPEASSDYQYYASDCVSNQCQRYVLVATLENENFSGGNIYQKTALN